MVNISDYISAALYRDYGAYLRFPDGFCRRDELTKPIARALNEMLAAYNAKEVADTTLLAENLFDELLASSVLVVHDDPFAGSYYKVSTNRLNAFFAKTLEGNAVHKAATSVGARFYPEVFSGYMSDASLEDRTEIEVPAADRIVTLNHNQVATAERPISEIIDALELDNGDPDQPGLRERLLGQIKAGRELVRSGEYRAYLLYVTLVRALGELVARYKNPTIQSLANALLGAIVGQLLQAS